eukprot:11518734-Heterocapsa_arctica.AAC.1
MKNIFLDIRSGNKLTIEWLKMTRIKYSNQHEEKEAKKVKTTIKLNQLKDKETQEVCNARIK